MKNNSKKIKNIFNAEIMSIIAVIVTTIAAMFFIGSALLVTDATGDDELTALGGIMIVAVVLIVLGIILVIASGIISIVNINALKGENKSFNNAMTWIIATFVISLISNLAMYSFPVFSGVSDAISDVSSFMMILYVSEGCAELCQDVGISGMVKNMRSWVLIAVILSAIGNLLSAFGLAASFMNTAAEVFTLVYNIAYLIVLSKSAKVLKAKAN